MTMTHLDYKTRTRLLLYKLGFPEFDEVLRCACPIHNGDNPTAFKFTFKSGWQCWTHKCHENYPKGLIGLVMAVKDISEDEAKKFLKKEIGDVKPSNKLLNITKPKKENIIFDKSILPKSFESKYFEERGFKKETVNFFKAFNCYSQQKKLYNRAVVPIFDDDDNLVAFTGRSLVNSQIKWLHQPNNFQKSRILYNLNNAKRRININKTAILVEGPLDVWRLHECGVYNSVALLGTSISQEQIQLLRKYDTKKVILLIDPDHAGLISMMKKDGILHKLSEEFMVFSFRHLLDDDIGEMSIEDIEQKIKPELRKILYLEN